MLKVANVLWRRSRCCTTAYTSFLLFSSPYLDRKDTTENDKKMRPTVAPLNLHHQSSADSDLPTTSQASTDRSCPSNLINGLVEIIVADDVVQAAVHDAFLEVILSEQIPDWVASSSSVI